MTYVAAFGGGGTISRTGTYPSWEEFLENETAFHGFSVTRDKNSVEGFCPYSLKDPKGGRKSSNVDSLYFMVLDLDKKPVEHIASLIHAIEREGYAALAHTTYSHPGSPEGTGCVRIILPLSEPVSAANWESGNKRWNFWKKAIEYFQDISGVAEPLFDEVCKDPGRLYYLPSVPAGVSQDSCFIYLLDGERPLSVDVVNRHQREMQAPVEGENAPEQKVLSYSLKPNHRPLLKVEEKIRRTVLKGIKKQSDNPPEGITREQFLDAYDAIELALVGQEYASEGHRNDTLYSVANALAFYFPEAKIDDLAEPFEISISLVEELSEDKENPAPNFESFKSMLLRCQQNHISQREEKVDTASPKEMYEATQGLNNLFRSPSGQALNPRPVLQHGKMLYVFNPKSLRFDVAVSADPKQISPAFETIRRVFPQFCKQVRYIASDEGPPKKVELNWREISDENFCHVQEVRLNMYEEEWYDQDSYIYHKSYVRRRKLTPTFHAGVDKWLRLLTYGDDKKYETLLDYLAKFPDNRRALAALAIVGPKSIGKTEFVKSLGRIWEAGAVSGENLFKNFNSSLIHTPVTYFDEDMGSGAGSHRRVVGTFLRSISSNSLDIDAKFKDISQLHGFFRVLCAFNTVDRFGFGRMSREELEAVGARLFLIDVNKQPLDIVNRLISAFDYQAFFENNQVAEHTLWLSENRDVDGDHRFGINVDSSRAILEGSIDLDTIFDWIYGYLRQNRNRPATRDDPVFLLPGRRLLVRPSKIYECWDDIDYLRKVRPTSGMAVKKMLDIVLSRESTTPVRGVFILGEQIRGNFLDLEAFLEHASNVDSAEYASAMLDLYPENLKHNVSEEQKEARKKASAFFQSVGELKVAT